PARMSRRWLRKGKHALRWPRGGCGFPDPGKQKPARGRSAYRLKIGRGDRIRTCDLYVPNVALYQPELHPDRARIIMDIEAGGQGFFPEFSRVTRRAWPRCSGSLSRRGA